MIAEREGAEQMLRHLGMITEQACEGIVVVDLKGVVHFVNTAWARMHGYKSSSKLVGKQISMFHTKEQMKTRVIPFIEQTKRKGRSMGQVGHVRRDGTTFTTQMKMTVVKDEKGKVSGLMVFVTDMTEASRLEETLSETTKQGEGLKEQIEQLQHEVTERRQAEERLKQLAGELTTSNEQHQREITEREQAEEHLKQQAAELTAADEQFQSEITERKQAEEHFRQQAAELTTANEQLQNEITERQQVEEHLKQQAADLTTSNEQLQHEVTERRQAEERLKQLAGELSTSNEQHQREITERQQAEERLKQQVAALTAVNEQLQHQVTERQEDKEMLGEDTEPEQAEESRELSEPLDVHKLKAISDLAKRLE